MSERKTVFDKVVTELQTITGIGKVTRDQVSFTQASGKDLPALYVENRVVEREYLSFQSPTLDDMEAAMEVEIRGRVWNIINEVESPLDDLLDNVETTLMNSTGLDAIVASIRPPVDEPDIEAADNFGEFMTRYEVRYFYNHTNP